MIAPPLFLVANHFLKVRPSGFLRRVSAGTIYNCDQSGVVLRWARRQGWATACVRLVDPSRRAGRNKRSHGRGEGPRVAAPGRSMSLDRLEVVLLEVVGDLVAEHSSLGIGGAEVNAS